MKGFNARTPEERQEVLKVLARVWEANPSLRLCQLLVNATNPPNNDPYYTTDRDLIKALQTYPKG